jgi:hypothetical protein
MRSLRTNKFLVRIGRDPTHQKRKKKKKVLYVLRTTHTKHKSSTDDWPAHLDTIHPGLDLSLIDQVLFF